MNLDLALQLLFRSRFGESAFRYDLDSLLVVSLHISHFIDLCEAALAKKPTFDVTTNYHLVVLIVESFLDNLLLSLVFRSSHWIARCRDGQTSVGIDVICSGNSWLYQRRLCHISLNLNQIVFSKFIIIT